MERKMPVFQPRQGRTVDGITERPGLAQNLQNRQPRFIGPDEKGAKPCAAQDHEVLIDAHDPGTCIVDVLKRAALGSGLDNLLLFGVKDFLFAGQKMGDLAGGYQNSPVGQKAKNLYLLNIFGQTDQVTVPR